MCPNLGPPRKCCRVRLLLHGRHALVVWTAGERRSGAPLQLHFNCGNRRSARATRIGPKSVGGESGGSKHGNGQSGRCPKRQVPLAPWTAFRVPGCATPPDVPFSNPMEVHAQGTEPDNLVDPMDAAGEKTFGMRRD
ncbi:hypothetical protein niasHT_009353 [Heterodera trifolii]|uniref:Uncharacterized protein n=1 Tax=Heterodera trifolii TaxID=157864 RepID=A0ABD2M3F1_9BILA